MAETQPAGGKARMREYETLFLVRADLPDDGIDKIKEKVRGAVTRQGGKVLKFTHWGKKKTAFLVAKQPRATYIHAHYLGTPGVVAEVERHLAIHEDVSKYASIRLADDVDPDSRPEEADVKLTGDADERPRTDRDAPEGERGPETPKETA